VCVGCVYVRQFSLPYAVVFVGVRVLGLLFVPPWPILKHEVFVCVLGCTVEFMTLKYKISKN
jgi:hypothetical protein